MTNTPNKHKSLCLDLMHADSEQEVKALLESAGFWHNDSAWRLLGDNENNFSTVGNQQSDAVGALAEKIVNSIDARLINAALEAGVEPHASGAPKSIREAVSTFIENNPTYDPDRHGMIRNWTRKETSQRADLITIAATGSKPGGKTKPCLTIADQGEGQTPDTFPDTFMSLQKSNKLRIPFVQGKFNMGGTGALQFCSPEFNLQLVVSRRNPRFATGNRSDQWGFTVVRRKPPVGGVRSSVYEYLAPNHGAVLSFTSPTMPLFPNGGFGKAYKRETEYGSLVKLYEYDWGGDRSDITRSTGGNRQGLLKRLEIKAADPALPFRLYECRDYKKDAPYHNALGIVNTLEERKEDLELIDGVDLSVAGHKLPSRIHLFRSGEEGKQRRADSGVFFLVNGQTHASLTNRFFDRRRVGKSYLRNDLLITVDCSTFEGREREDLFMNSRDRLRRGDVANQLERELEGALSANQKLRDANYRRREKALHNSMASSDTVSKVLRDIFANNRELARYLIEGGSIGGTRGPIGPSAEFQGLEYPTYVRFRQTHSSSYRRKTDIGSRVTVSLESDADAGYFDRIASPGRWKILDRDDNDVSGDWGRTGPDDGQINFTTKLSASESAGQLLKYTIVIDDDEPNRFEPFKNHLMLELEHSKPTEPNSNPPPPQTTHKYAPPKWNPVEEANWAERSFNQDSALAIVPSDSNSSQAYDFFVNVDNRSVIAHSQKLGEDLVANRSLFGNALTLIGLALIREHEIRLKSEEPSEDTENISVRDYVAQATAGMATVLLPMLKSFVTEPLEESDQSENLP